MLMSAAYATVMGVLTQLISADTLVISDALNHNCIIKRDTLSPAGRHRDLCSCGYAGPGYAPRHQHRSGQTGMCCDRWYFQYAGGLRTPG
jgi:hypothetical protein